VKEFAIWSKVLVENDTKKNKFEPNYNGPYAVMDRVGNSYKLADIMGDALTNRQPIHKLKKVEIVDTAEPSYEVEKILDKRGAGSTTQYKVRWKGYEPEHDLFPGQFDSHQLIFDYNKRKAEKNKSTAKFVEETTKQLRELQTPKIVDNKNNKISGKKRSDKNKSGKYRSDNILPITTKSGRQIKRLTKGE
jgi:hypothetical protein